MIAVTGPDRGGEAAWVFTRIALFIAGGRAVRITPCCPRSLHGIHGLVIGGGADVDPRLYGADLTPVRPDPKRPDQSWLRYLVGFVVFPIIWIFRKLSGKSGSSRGTHGDPARDALELRLLAEAVRRNLPILGICRGQQLMNVHFGGSLHQNLTSFYIEDAATRTILPKKRIVPEPGATLGKLFGTGTRVNALHTQGIDKLGKGLRVAARDRNGIVQAIEHETHPFVVGVQWHPEYLPQLPSQRAIFKTLVDQARLACKPPR